MEEEKKEEIKVEDKKLDKKKMKKSTKFIIAIIIIAILVCIAMFAAKAYLIKSLVNKAKGHQEFNNYHIYSTVYNKNTNMIWDIYYKDGKYIQKLYSFSYDLVENKEVDYKNLVYYYDGISESRIVLNEVERKMELQEVVGEENKEYKSTNVTPKMKNQVIALGDNFPELMKTTFFYKIQKTKVNGIDCYRFSFGDDDRYSMFIDANTGLTLRVKSVSTTLENITDDNSDTIFEFNTVTDEDVKMPIIDGYQL